MHFASRQWRTMDDKRETGRHGRREAKGTKRRAVSLALTTIAIILFLMRQKSNEYEKCPMRLSFLCFTLTRELFAAFFHSSTVTKNSVKHQAIIYALQAISFSLFAQRLSNAMDVSAIPFLSLPNAVFQMKCWRFAIEIEKVKMWCIGEKVSSVECETQHEEIHQLRVWVCVCLKHFIIGTKGTKIPLNRFESTIPSRFCYCDCCCCWNDWHEQCECKAWHRNRCKHVLPTFQHIAWMRACLLRIGCNLPYYLSFFILVGVKVSAHCKADSPTNYYYSFFYPYLIP